MKTLTIRERVLEALVGHATITTMHPLVEVGRCGPTIFSGEDAEAIIQAPFLDPTAPVDVNLTASGAIRKALDRWDKRYDPDERMMHPRDVISRRPSFGFVPAEIFDAPRPRAGNQSPVALAAAKILAKSGPIGEAIGDLRATETNAGVWTRIAQEKLLGRYVTELLQEGRNLGVRSFVAPVPAIDSELQSSPTIAASVNQAVMRNWPELRNAGSSSSPPDLLYGFSVSASALEDEELLRLALLALSNQLGTELTDDGEAAGDNYYAGVHIQFGDLELISKSAARVRAARDLVQKVATVGRRHGRYTVVSNVGQTGPVHLDLGAAFSTYLPGMNIGRRIRAGGGGGDGDQDVLSGKALVGTWDWTMVDRKQVRSRKDKLPDTGLTSPEVSAQALESAKKYRVHFAKPHNIAVMERYNHLREAELQKKNGRSGYETVAKSGDGSIAIWAL